MTGFLDRVRALCNDKGISVWELERRLGMANGYIANTEKRGSSPSAKRIAIIANYLGVTSEYLLTGASSSSSGVMIPLLGRVAAGLPISAVENIIGQEEISRKLASAGEFFALRIKGDSMSPYIMDGDVVIVRQQDDAETGDIIIAIVNGNDGCCKKLRKIASGITLISINPLYDPLVFDHAEVDTIPVRIAGKVVEIRREL